MDGAGLTTRHWTAGTLNGDAADGVLAKAAWSRPDTWSSRQGKVR
ncbi:hypothetical protein [Streptomyces sp. NPDC101145]